MGHYVLSKSAIVFQAFSLSLLIALLLPFNYIVKEFCLPVTVQHQCFRYSLILWNFSDEMYIEFGCDHTLIPKCNICQRHHNGVGQLFKLTSTIIREVQIFILTVNLKCEIAIIPIFSPNYYQSFKNNNCSFQMLKIYHFHWYECWVVVEFVNLTKSLLPSYLRHFLHIFCTVFS